MKDGTFHIPFVGSFDITGDASVPTDVEAQNDTVGTSVDKKKGKVNYLIWLPFFRKIPWFLVGAC